MFSKRINTIKSALLNSKQFKRNLDTVSKFFSSIGVGEEAIKLSTCVTELDDKSGTSAKKW